VDRTLDQSLADPWHRHRPAGTLATGGVSAQPTIPAPLSRSAARSRTGLQSGLAPLADLVPLDEQDRSLWDQAQIQAGLRLLAAATDASPGPYRLQAAIAALHATARTPEAADWERIVQAYDALLAISGTPVVALNRLIAVSYRDGPDVALAGLPDVAHRLDGSPLVAATRADLLRREGRLAEAEAAYLAAIDTTGNDTTGNDTERH
jgi:predicted RNA polymerase sigma factor